MAVSSATGSASGAATATGAGPSGGRLPSVRRERRPALAALALLLILGGGLASGLMAYRSGQRSDFLVLARDVAPGQKLTAGDLGIARIAGTGARAIPASAEYTRAVGHYLTVGGRQGTLLNELMLTEAAPIPAGSAVVGVTVQDGQAPAGGVQAGDVVQVLRVPSGGGGSTPAVLVRAARVMLVVNPSGGSGGLVGGTGSGGSTVVNVLVPGDTAGAVASAANQHLVALVLLPPGTSPVVGS